ncbi:MAG: hypothetical protein N2381_01680, partial [Armatimonadetes bacterium]|nr:hypothetical protein [Armatimonadota bacterium]
DVYKRQVHDLEQLSKQAHQRYLTTTQTWSIGDVAKLVGWSQLYVWVGTGSVCISSSVVNRWVVGMAT